MKLELGSGQRPTPGYIHNDVTEFDGIDCVAPAHEVWFPDGSLDEVLALGVIEHLTHSQAQTTFVNVHRMLKPGGEFVFDVPDLMAWGRYLMDDALGVPTPFTREHILCTLFGWQRWPGDEHKWGWFREALDLEFEGWSSVTYGVEQFLERGHDRRRFHRPEDAHLYLVATK